ncbi:MAG TPA: DUF3014 domain-containing protein [Ramlibacter sp.]|uniref:DUF3014 domain-containing protein n=1 Tax=Ramlibacter sp. TaxID=1917967 RepID=UPI002ED25E8A
MATPHTADLRLDPDDMRFGAPRPGRLGPIFLGALAGLAALAGYVWWSQQPHDPASARVTVAPAPPAEKPAAAVEPQYPDPVAPNLAPLTARDVAAAVSEFVGRSGFVQTEEFAHRFAATVDNLARAHAAPMKWPVTTTPGRFTVQAAADGEGQVIAPANAQRYAPFVAFATSLDSAAAAGLYARMYPLLQQSYRELGYPGRSFHNRLIAVIDNLLAAPEPSGPVHVRLTEVKGPVASTRPWVRYEFEDERLEQLAAGQKMLVRMGPENERRLKTKLREIRTELVKPR